MLIEIYYEYLSLFDFRCRSLVFITLFFDVILLFVGLHLPTIKVQYELCNKNCSRTCESFRITKNVGRVTESK